MGDSTKCFYFAPVKCFIMWKIFDWAKLMDKMKKIEREIYGCNLAYQATSQNPGANFTNRLKLSHLSLCIRFKPQNRLKSVGEIGTRFHKYGSAALYRSADQFMGRFVVCF